MRHNVILSDADGCLLNWNKGFEQFMDSKGFPRLPGTDSDYTIHTRHDIPTTLAHQFVKEFNEGPLVADLEPFADSVEYVPKIVELGFRFTIVTSISSHPDAKINRTKNLKAIFGDIFDEIVCLEMGISKAHELMRWADTGYFWIEDHMRQAEAGYEAGLNPILINHPYNTHYETDLFPKVSVEHPWKEIYGAVLNRYF